MRIFNRLIIYLALALGLINAVLAFTGQSQIEVYFLVYFLAYLAITLLYVYLNPRAKGALTAITAVLFTPFLIVIALKVMSTLGIGFK